MGEDMAHNGDPSAQHIAAYAAWGGGGWGCVITGQDALFILKNSNPEGENMDTC